MGTNLFPPSAGVIKVAAKSSCWATQEIFTFLVDGKVFTSQTFNFDGVSQGNFKRILRGVPHVELQTIFNTSLFDLGIVGARNS